MENMGKVVKLKESEILNVIKSVISEQKIYTDFDNVYDYKIENNHWYTKKKSSTSDKWYDITDRPAAVNKLNSAYGTNVKTTAKPADVKPVTAKPTTTTPPYPIRPEKPAVADVTYTQKPDLKSIKVGPTTLTNAVKNKTPLIPPANTKLAVVPKQNWPKPKDLPLPAPSTPIPNDVKQILSDKSKNPKFAKYTGKYYILSKENSIMYVFNNKHQLIDHCVVGRGKVVGDFPNRADPESGLPGASATTPAGSGVFKSPIYSPDYRGKFAEIEYNDPSLDPEGGIGIHPIYPPEFIKRNAILQDPNITHKLMSWGCINVPKEALLRPTFAVNAGDSIFISKEPAELQALAMANKQRSNLYRNKTTAMNIQENKKKIRITESQLKNVIKNMIDDQSIT